MPAIVIPFQAPEKPAILRQGERRHRIKVLCLDAAERAENPFVKLVWRKKAYEAAYLPTADLNKEPARRYDFTPDPPAAAPAGLMARFFGGAL